MSALDLLNPFGLFTSAFRGAAQGIAHDLEPEHHEAPPPAPPPPAPPPAPAPPPLRMIRKPIRPLGLAAKPAHSTAFYVAAGGAAAIAVVGVGYLAFARRS